jgi:hypothetical protein
MVILVHKNVTVLFALFVFPFLYRRPSSENLRSRLSLLSCPWQLSQEVPAFCAMELLLSGLDVMDILFYENYSVLFAVYIYIYIWGATKKFGEFKQRTACSLLRRRRWKLWVAVINFFMVKFSEFLGSLSRYIYIYTHTHTYRIYSRNLRTRVFCAP